MEIAKRLNAIIAQLLPFLSQEVNMTTDLFWILCKHAPLDSVTCKLFIWRWFIGIYIFCLFQHQQQVVTAVERAKQVTMTELNAIVGVSLDVTTLYLFQSLICFQLLTSFNY